MVRALRVLFVAIVLLAGLPHTSHARPWSVTRPSEDFVGGYTALVQAVVDSLDTKGRDTVSTQRITRVYCGPQDWVGKTFVRKLIGGVRNSGITFPTRAQLNGIYILEGTTDRFNVNILRSRTNYEIPPISLEDKPEQYAGALHFAQAVEQVCRAAPDQQLTVLSSLVGNPTPTIEVWAIRELGARGLPQANNAPDPEAKKLLETLLPKVASTKGKLAFDEAMSWQDKVVPAPEKLWRTSPVRLTLLQTLLRTGTPDDVALTLSRLNIAVQDEAINGRDAFDLASESLQSERNSLQLRQSAARSLGFMIARKAYAPDNVFSFLVTLIRSNAPVETRLASVAAFEIFTPSAEQSATLTQLQQETDRPEIKAALAESLAHLQHTPVVK